MPRISLVVCVYKEYDLLERLLNKAQGCYDDLVVVHDGPENCHNANSSETEGGETGWESPEHLSLSAPDVPPLQVSRDYATKIQGDSLPTGYRLTSGRTAAGSIHQLVSRYGGSFYEGPRCFQQEPHWPFAWSVAKHDWILRLDADEYPEFSLKQWILDFRMEMDGIEQIPGFTCNWPMWNGFKTVTTKWPRNRMFLFNKKRIRYFAMAEQIPIIDSPTFHIDFCLIHAPTRKSYGYDNILLRRQAYIWRLLIAKSLLKKTSEFPRWNWDTENWPADWQRVRTNPFRAALFRLLAFSFFQTISLWKWERKINLSATTSGAIHHFIFSIQHGLEQISNRNRF